MAKIQKKYFKKRLPRKTRRRIESNIKKNFQINQERNSILPKREKEEKFFLQT